MKDETRFTPGPWEIDGFHTSAVIARVAGRWQRVADADQHGFGSNPNWKADAKLIAAAPCLYEALSAIVAAEEDAMREWHDSGAPPWGEEHPAYRRYIAARAALARVNGSPQAQDAEISSRERSEP